MNLRKTLVALAVIGALAKPSQPFAEPKSHTERI